MKKLLALSLLLLSFPALAQQALQTRAGDSGPIWFDKDGHVIVSSHLVSAGATPTLTNCGNSSILGSDLSGVITISATALANCSVVFNKPYINAPICNVTWPGGPLAAMSWTASATGIDIVQTSTGRNQINYICHGKQ